jgi:DNA-binding NtrC family response regulator
MNEHMYPKAPVLIVDDEKAAVTGCELTLETDGISNLRSLMSGREVMPLLETEEVSAVLLDLSMPPPNGEFLLKEISEKYPHIPVIIVTGHNELETAVRCMKTGAFDYLVKPVHETRLTSAVRRAVDMRELRSEYASFKDKVFSQSLSHPEAFRSIITVSRKMHSLFQYVETIAPSSRSVLITGETGSGKELIARAVHAVSGRKGPFTAVNAAALDDTVFSDTLFGHVKGAFTGADAARSGLVERASEGTLFLDEIGDLEMSSQVKLLRLLQENEYYPLGADAAKPSDARIVVATNKSVDELRSSSKFRSDLFFRLETHSIRLPALRERIEDIPSLLNAFLEKAALELKKKVPTPPPELSRLLSTYHFPGNIRELEAMVFDAVSRHRTKVLSMETFKAHIARHTKDSRLSTDFKSTSSTENRSPFSLFERLPTLADAEVLLIEEALSRAQGNHTAAAALLGITRSGLSKAIKRKGIGA